MAASVIHCQGINALKYQSTKGQDNVKPTLDKVDVRFIIEVEKDKIEPLIKKFQEHCIPKKNATLERQKLGDREQRPGESFDSFLTDIKLMIKDCEYRDLTDSILIDCIIRGIKCEQTKMRLLREADMTLDRAISLCRAAETATNHMKAMSSEHSQQVTHSINKHKGKQRTHQNEQTNRQQQKAPPGNRGYRAFKPPPPPPNSQNNEKMKGTECGYCGYRHVRGKCPAYGQSCNKCGGIGHFRKKCRSRKVHLVNDNSYEAGATSMGESKFTEFFVDIVNDSGEVIKPWIVPLDVNKTVVQLKLDTGSDVNILPLTVYNKLCVKSKLKPTSVKLSAYAGSEIPVKGQCILTVEHKGHSYKVLFIISPAHVQPILGRKMCDTLGLIKRVLAVNNKNKENMEAQKELNLNINTDNVFSEFPDLFQGLGCLPCEVNIKLRDKYVPVVEPCRKIPFALHNKVKDELDRMETMGVITKVNEPTEFVNSMTVVTKPNGKIRICLDPRNLNKAILREHYKLPTRDEIMANFSGARYFTKLDASSGFWQLPLGSDSSHLCTFNTPFGRYRYLRLPFGISSAPEIYHREIHSLFENIEGVDTSMDDIIVWANDKELHDSRLRQVLSIIRKQNMRLQPEKCQYCVSKLTFLGDLITTDGLQPDPKKVQAITEFTKPECKKDIQRFLGMVNYVGRYISELSSRTAPLRKLLDKTVQFEWTDEQEKAWEDLKQAISQQPVLQFYNPDKAIRISADASKSGIGAALLQKYEDNWLPVAYASRAMTQAECKYAQIEKETLAITYACEHFHQYVYGQSFEVESDHKPLQAIFSKGLNDCPPRLQRFRLRLQKYDFTIDGLVLKGSRIVIPRKLRELMLTKIHKGHLGQEKCKRRAREVMFWPRMNQDIDNVVENCELCVSYRSNQQCEPLLPHHVATRPWQKVATDLCYIDNKTYLVLVDYYSTYPEISLLTGSGTTPVVQALKSMFARHGIPDEVISDNGPCYSSDQFSQFSKDWGFVHTTSSPLYPQSNGLAEKCVQIVKRLLKKAHDSGDDPYLGLLVYRSTPLQSDEMLKCLPGRSNTEIKKNIRIKLNNSTKAIKKKSTT